MNIVVSDQQFHVLIFNNIFKIENHNDTIKSIASTIMINDINTPVTITNNVNANTVLSDYKLMYQKKLDIMSMA